MTKDKAGGEAEAKSGILAWWGADGVMREALQAHVERMRAFSTGLQAAYGDGCREQLELVSAANLRLVDSAQAFTRCRKPEDFMSAGADLATAMVEGASAQSRHLFEFGGKVRDCCSDMARDAAESVRGQMAGDATHAPPRP